MENLPTEQSSISEFSRGVRNRPFTLPIYVGQSSSTEVSKTQFIPVDDLPFIKSHKE